jgi:protein-S-isoprenylcysteine O-methyltransferase Ste14
MAQFVVFLIGSTGLINLSPASLRAPRSHGFYRFFAWECILALFLLNSEVWFQTPLVWYQLISWFLLALCLVPLILGVRTLKSRGKPVAQREAEPQLLDFEKTSSLVTSGIYHYIRHPLYSSLLLLTWGIFFKAHTWPGLFLAIAATLLLFATAKADEAECLRFFGAPYQEYMKQSKRFVPFVF